MLHLGMLRMLLLRSLLVLILELMLLVVMLLLVVLLLLLILLLLVLLLWLHTEHTREARHSGWKRLFRIGHRVGFFFRFHASILEPNLDLPFGQLQLLGNFHASTARQIATGVELALQLDRLGATVRLAAAFACIDCE